MSEYKCKDGMIDNRKVKDNHQGGIERVKQRGHDKMDSAGHDGKMGRRADKAHWSRRGESMTPCKA